MKKSFIFFTFIILSLTSFSQGPPRNNSYWQWYTRSMSDSAVGIPIQDTLRTGTQDTTHAYIFYYNGNLYVWAHGVYYTVTGGATIDTTSISNRINQRLLISDTIGNFNGRFLSSITSNQVTGALGYTPLNSGITLSINGQTYDLTGNRSWSVGTLKGTDTISLSNRINALAGAAADSSIFFTDFRADTMRSNIYPAIAAKQSAISGSNTANQYWNGYKNFVSLNSDSLNEGSTNLFFTAIRARGAISNLLPITYNSTTGQIGADTSGATDMLLSPQRAANTYQVKGTYQSPLYAGYGLNKLSDSTTLKADSTTLLPLADSTTKYTSYYRNLFNVKYSDSTSLFATQYYVSQHSGIIGWGLTGTSATFGNYLGTSNNLSLRLRTNGAEYARFDSLQSVRLYPTLPAGMDTAAALNIQAYHALTSSTDVFYGLNIGTKMQVGRGGFNTPSDGAVGLQIKQGNTVGAGDAAFRILDSANNVQITMNSNGTPVAPTGTAGVVSCGLVDATQFITYASGTQHGRLLYETGNGTELVGDNSTPISFVQKVSSQGGVQLLVIFNNGDLVAQTAPNGTALTDANPSAKLAINSTTQGFLAPRMTATERSAVSSPGKGLMCIDSTTDKPYIYNGTNWLQYSAVTKGTGTLTAGTTTTVTDANCYTTSEITLQATSAAFTALGTYVSSVSASSFVVTSLTAAGTETFSYTITN